MVSEMLCEISYKRLMIRSTVLSIALVASSAAGAVGLSVLHRISYKTDVAIPAAPVNHGSFVIPATVQVDDVPVKAIAPVLLAQPDDISDDPIAIPVSLSDPRFDTSPDNPIENLIRPRARPLATTAPVDSLAKASPHASGAASRASVNQPSFAAPRKSRQRLMEPTYMIGVYR